jgi:predicted  nucleic acid-binding Zn-ribbon protein
MNDPEEKAKTNDNQRQLEEKLREMQKKYKYAKQRYFSSKQTIAKQNQELEDQKNTVSKQNQELEDQKNTVSFYKKAMKAFGNITAKIQNGPIEFSEQDILADMQSQWSASDDEGDYKNQMATSTK